MPTTARLTAAILFGLLTFAFAYQAQPYFPEAQQPTYWLYLNAGAGAIIGWVICGAKAGAGYQTGLANGITTIVTVIICVFFVMSFFDMIDKAFRRSYEGPIEAVVNVFQLMLEWGEFFLVQELGILLLFGSILAGLVTEFIGRRLP